MCLIRKKRLLRFEDIKRLKTKIILFLFSTAAACKTVLSRRQKRRRRKALTISCLTITSIWECEKRYLEMILFTFFPSIISWMGNESSSLCRKKAHMRIFIISCQNKLTSYIIKVVCVNKELRLKNNLMSFKLLLIVTQLNPTLWAFKTSHEI